MALPRKRMGKSSGPLKDTHFLRLADFPTLSAPFEATLPLPCMNSSLICSVVLTTLFVGSDFAAAGAMPLTGKSPVEGKAPALPPVPPLDRSRFRISAGAGYRSLDKVEFNSGSRSGGIRLPFLATALARQSSSAGSTSDVGSRRYEDGYVDQDAGTERDGNTWNWGYDNASQLSADGSTLSFHGTGDSQLSTSRRSWNGEPESWHPDAEGAVPLVKLEWEYDFTPRLTGGISLQYSFLGFDGGNAQQTFSATQSQSSQGYRLTDSYDTSSIIVPQAPYQNSFAGPGPLINNIPSARSVNEGALLEGNEVGFFNRIEDTLDVKLHSLAFGPTFAVVSGRVHLVLGAGLSLNIADWEATHTETLYVKRNRKAARVYQQWSDKSSDTEILPGVYLQAAARVKLTQRFSLTAFAQYDWSDTVDGKVGPSAFQIDPSGWTLGGMIGFTF